MAQEASPVTFASGCWAIDLLLSASAVSQNSSPTSRNSLSTPRIPPGPSASLDIFPSFLLVFPLRRQPAPLILFLVLPFPQHPRHRVLPQPDDPRPFSQPLDGPRIGREGEPIGRDGRGENIDEQKSRASGRVEGGGRKREEVLPPACGEGEVIDIIVSFSAGSVEGYRAAAEKRAQRKGDNNERDENGGEKPRRADPPRSQMLTCAA